MFDEQDTKMMARALDLARRPVEPPYPNPRVGAVIARDGEVLSEGWHAAYDAPHAEYMALEKLGFRAPGATIYVTLEPCCPFPGKRNPACSELIVAAGIARAVIALPHPFDGENRGRAIMEEGGVKVETGLLAEEAEWLVAGLFHYRRTGRPMVAAKWAMTADGLIAPPDRKRGKISSSEGFRFAHLMRHRADAVLVGVGTVLADDPMLDCREAGFSHPVRVVADPRLETPPGSKVAATARERRTVVLCAEDAPQERERALEKLGVEVARLRARGGELAPSDMLAALAERNCLLVLVEGGASVHGRFFDAGLVDEYMIVVAPKLLGGRDSLHPIGGKGRGDLAQCVPLADFRVERLGEDLLLRGRPVFDGRRATRRP
ncbi:MAG: bifunctional diaminohydroxyphosphoribosylaminopyrimidine deaminase/5-amino-6-(5-phosphoribosylamino)uracil reductase RibD [Planctomycetota bacterium]|nr:MAG: bifunctional diaminohydroxyphosphoribosylaminopyrimidine deaminase/5-amino-6-(5-phosphoribosylamino)uracil reductase RibD [Planctomycetota bacterium]